MAEMLDVVELTVNLPGHSLLAGNQGTVVELHAEGKCEVEFINDEGETTGLVVLNPDQFTVVWRATTKTWVPVPDRLATLAERLPEDARQELLDFARFLNASRQSGYASPTPMATAVLRDADDHN